MDIDVETKKSLEKYLDYFVKAREIYLKTLNHVNSELEKITEIHSHCERSELKLRDMINELRVRESHLLDQISEL